MSKLACTLCFVSSASNDGLTTNLSESRVGIPDGGALGDSYNFLGLCSPGTGEPGKSWYLKTNSDNSVAGWSLFLVELDLLFPIGEILSCLEYILSSSMSPQMM